MSKDSSQPATKADIQNLLEVILKLQAEVSDLRTETSILRRDTEKWKDELIHHFEIAFENFRIDLEGAYGDQINWLRDVQKLHAKRLNRLEVRVGV
jgi:hypothetical protein